MREPAVHRSDVRRIATVVLLLVAAFFVALPWLTCMGSIRAGTFAFPNLGPMWRVCTIGVGISFPTQHQIEVPGFTGPYWGNLILGLVYVAAAVYATVSRRPL